jgi:hypothetical protein
MWIKPPKEVCKADTVHLDAGKIRNTSSILLVGDVNMRIPACPRDYPHGEGSNSSNKPYGTYIEIDDWLSCG